MRTYFFNEIPSKMITSYDFNFFQTDAVLYSEEAEMFFIEFEEKANDYAKIRVTHGPGTRIYYEKLGYDLEEYYMVKKLK